MEDLLCKKQVRSDIHTDTISTNTIRSTTSSSVLVGVLSSSGHGLIILCVCVCVCVFFEHVVGLVVDFLTIIWIAKVDDSTNRKKEGFL